MRKNLILLLCVLSVLAILLRFGLPYLLKSNILKGRSGIRVESNQRLKVFIDQQQVGETPFSDENMLDGNYFVDLKPNEASDSAKSIWQGYVKLNAGTVSVINREIQPNQIYSAGEVITLTPGDGAIVTSNPPGAEVSIDGRSIGRTPISVSPLSSGEHQIMVSKENFLKRNIRSVLIDGYSLHIAVDLAVAEADLSKITTIPISSSQVLVVKPNSAGFLRLRSNPSTSAQEVARLIPGDTLNQIEEINGWYRVKTMDGKEGYVSSSFVEKKS